MLDPSDMSQRRAVRVEHGTPDEIVVQVFVGGEHEIDQRSGAARGFLLDAAELAHRLFG